LELTRSSSVPMSGLVIPVLKLIVFSYIANH